MDKNELVESLNLFITAIDVDTDNVNSRVKEYIRLSTDSKLQTTLQWHLAHLNRSYVDYVHDLERLIKTLKGESFSGNNI